MATEKWVAGATAGWVTAFTTPPGALTSGQAILSDLSITNSALDMFADVSIHLGSAVFAAPNFIGVYLYPLNYGGSVYGDGRFGSAATGPPPPQYWVGNIGLVVGTQVQDGILTRIILPPGTFSWVLWNQGGVTLNATNVCQYRTYNRSIA
jgi:hypothetical protein